MKQKLVFLTIAALVTGCASQSQDIVIPADITHSSGFACWRKATAFNAQCRTNGIWATNSGCCNIYQHSKRYLCGVWF
jgi:hypothetical protein